MMTGTNTNKAEIALNTAIFFKLIEQPQSEENTAILKGLIADGINHGITRGNTPLHHVIAHNRSDMIQCLIANGANIALKNSKNDTPLHLAVRKHDFESTKILLDNKAYVNVKDFFGKTPFHLAIIQNDQSIIELLLDHPLAIEALDEYNNTPLLTAIALGDFAVAKQLLDRNANVNASNYYTYTPLSLAVEAGNIEFVRQLLAKGAKIETTYACGDTLLHYAARNNDTAMTQLLIDNRAAIDDNNLQGITPLGAAIHRSNFETAQVLIDNNANVIAKNYYFGSTALHLAAQITNSQLVQQILNKGANISARDNENNTPLHLATQNNDPEVFKTLLDNGADFEAQNNNGDTPLKFAARNSKLDKYLPVVIKKITATGRFDYLQEAFFAHFPSKDMTIIQEQAQNEILANLPEEEALTIEEIQLTKEDVLDTPEKIMAANIATYSQEEQFKMIEIVEQQYANAKLFSTSLTSKMLFSSNVDYLTPSPTLLLSQNLQPTTLEDVSDTAPVAVEDLLDALNIDPVDGDDLHDTPRNRP